MKYDSTMAAGPSNFPSWFTVLALLSLLLSVASADGRSGSQPCVDGTYEHDGRTCCLCGAGLFLEKHCTTNLKYGICKTCDTDKYSSHPNNQESCEPCTSCSQPNANLEVDEHCTPARDTMCRCKKGHFCSSGIEPCRICYSCKECGAEGIKVPCTATNDTVCNDKIEGGTNIGIIVGITMPIVSLLIGLALLALFWKRRRDRQQKHSPAQLTNVGAGDVEMQPLTVPDVDLQPYFTDIAEVIGWRDMRDVAMRDLLISTIESCQLNHPDNSQEQTRELLKIWVENQGKAASGELVRSLLNRGKRGKAEKVRDILSGPSHPA